MPELGTMIRNREAALPASRIEEALVARGLEDGGKLAVADGETAWSYAGLARRAAGVAASLTAAGVAPGDRVCVYLDRTPACVAALYGAWLAGAVVVPVNEGLRSRLKPCLLIELWKWLAGPFALAVNCR